MRARAAALLAVAFCFHAQATEPTNSPPPVTARDFYNAGTEFLAATNFAGAEQMFESAIAAQDDHVQPPALYNLGEAQFADGIQRLKKGPNAQKAVSQGNAGLAAGGNAIRSLESVLAETNIEKMVAAYLEGRGARRNLREAEKAVQAAMESYGTTLRLWQGAADHFKSAAELNPADTNATRNAEIVEHAIARLVDRSHAMQPMLGNMGDQKQQLFQLLSKLKGRIPQANQPPGDGGDDEDEDVQPDSLAGQKENASREGEQMQIPLSPDQAGQILDGLSLDGTRRLAVSDQQGSPPGERKGRNW